MKLSKDTEVIDHLWLDDVESCLTPSHLVCGKRIFDLPNGKVQLGLLDS